MAKKKPEPKSSKDMAMNVFSVGGGLVLLLTIMPFVPWRYARINNHLGSRFVSDRKYTLFTLGNNFGQGVSWLKMRRDMCMKMEEFNRPDPIKAVLGAAAGAIGGGGAVVGCATWPACKNHVSTRCYTYATMGIVGLISMLLLLVSAVCGFLSPVMQSMEGPVTKKKKSKKKKKALMEAQFTTMLVSIGGFVPAFLATIGWIFTSDNQFKGLQSSAYYPWPGASAGMFLAGLGCFFMFIGMILGIVRRQGADDDKEEEDEGEGEYEAYDAAAEPLPPSANVLMPGLPPPPP